MADKKEAPMDQLNVRVPSDFLKGLEKKAESMSRKSGVRVSVGTLARKILLENAKRY